MGSRCRGLIFCEENVLQIKKLVYLCSVLCVVSMFFMKRLLLIVVACVVCMYCNGQAGVGSSPTHKLLAGYENLSVYYDALNGRNYTLEVKSDSRYDRMPAVVRLGDSGKDLLSVLKNMDDALYTAKDGEKKNIGGYVWTACLNEKGLSRWEVAVPRASGKYVVKGTGLSNLLFKTILAVEDVKREDFTVRVAACEGTVLYLWLIFKRENFIYAQSVGLLLSKSAFEDNVSFNNRFDFKKGDVLNEKQILLLKSFVEKFCDESHVHTSFYKQVAELFVQ